MSKKLKTSKKSKQSSGSKKSTTRGNINEESYEYDDFDVINNEEISGRKRTNTKAKKSKKSKKSKKKITNNNSDENISNDNDVIRPKQINLAAKTREHLKKKINDWLDCDDKIKLLNVKVKQYKDEKKRQEEFIIKVISKLGMEGSKIDVHDTNHQLRSRVYKHKSTTKGALKENIIKAALMEATQNEKLVDQLFKKMDSKRPIIERHYLKRTKGVNDDNKN
jgi:hypothetical protein